MTLTRRDIDEYVCYAKRLSTDLEVTIADLQFRADEGALHLAVDFSEVHSYLLPEQLDDSWLWPGLDQGMKTIVEHSALSEVLTGPPKPMLLPPYLLEFQTFLTTLRSGVWQKMLASVPSAIDTLEELTQRPQAQSHLQLAATVARDQRDLTSEELDTAVSFFESTRAISSAWSAAKCSSRWRGRAPSCKPARLPRWMVSCTSG